MVDGFWFGPTDPRLYALVRIFYSIAAIANWIDLFLHRAELFTDRGMFTWAAVQSAAAGHELISVFSWARSESGVTLVMAVVGIALCCLLVGAYTRLAALVVVLWNLSYSTRLIPFDCAHDALFRVIGLLLLISPISVTWSLDSWRKRKRGPSEGPGTVPVYGLRLLQWQVMLLYVVAFWSKVGDSYWRNGETVTYFLLSSYSNFATPQFAEWPRLMAAATYVSLTLELALPFLLWIPRTRLIGFALGFGFHLLIAYTSSLRLLSLVTLSAYFAFLDGASLDRWCRGWLPSARPRHVPSRVD